MRIGAEKDLIRFRFAQPPSPKGKAWCKRKSADLPEMGNAKRNGLPQPLAGLRGGRYRKCESARNGQDSSLTLRMTGRGHAFPYSVILRPQAEESFYCLSARVRCTDYASSRIVGNANRRYANAFVYCRFRRFIGDRTCVSGTKHFIRSAGRSAPCAAGDHQKRKLSARRGVDRKARRFLSPRRVLLWSFLPTREESGVPEMIESTI